MKFDRQPSDELPGSKLVFQITEAEKLRRIVDTLGLITYMRTDSLRLSDEAMAAAADFIRGRYGKEYYYGKFHVYKTKAGAQDAHEAIRPTHVELDPERVRSSLTLDQYKLYKLIWSRFLASQMANAVYDTVATTRMRGSL